ncbi:MAG: hypothetical protein KJ017_09910 [Alphaproteobacteria bacterium]|nr:hypothetical protein [Alphaproteobacteria bacterium]
MGNVHGNIRLRPIRIGLLVRPTDIKSIREFMRYNSCLWGGIYNPIIPVTSGRLPKAWEQEEHGRPKGLELAKRYIDFFEPDVFVEAEKGLALKLGYEEDELSYGDKRVVTLDHFFSAQDRYSAPSFRFGLNISDVYKKLYKEDFKFVKKIESKFALFEKSDPFFEAVFGVFPNKKNLSYLRKGYENVFSAEKMLTDLSAYKKVIKNNIKTPFSLSEYKIETYFPYRVYDPLIYVFDPRESTDLIDFWNLNIFSRDVWPINILWFEELKDEIINQIKRNYMPLPRNPNGVMIATTIEFSQSISKEYSEKLVKSNISQNVEKGSFSYKQYYSPIWKGQTDEPVSCPKKVHLTAEKDFVELNINEKEKYAYVECLTPKFLDKDTLSERYRWANVLNLSSRFHDENIATCFPPQKNISAFPHLTRGTPLIVSHEGLVIINEHLRGKTLLDILSGEEAFIEWFKSNDLEAEISPAGRTTKQIISAVKGIWGTRIFAHKEVVEKLTQMAGKTVSRSNQTGETTIEYDDKTAATKDWVDLIKILGEKKRFVRKLTLDDFTKNNILKLGIFISCDYCEKKNWYDLEEINYNPQCDRCLKHFDFPQGKAPTNRDIFRYRVVGPFSTPNAADGGYTTALTLRVFSETLGMGDKKITYTTGVQFKSFQNREIDFAIWYQRERILEDNSSVDIIFGESKTSAKEAFKENDMKIMYDLAQKFPSSYFVFSALKNEFSEEEKALLGKFALWGREYHKGYTQRAHVIVLTEKELLCAWNISQMWEESGGKHAELVKPAYIRLDKLRNLADFTQQLYLGLPSFWTWREEKFKSRKKRVIRK